MAWVALVGPEVEENLSLRYLASSLARAGFGVEIVPFNAAEELRRALDTILAAEESPTVVAVSLAFQWRAKDFLALAVALKEHGYTGHITAGGHFGTFACRELLADFPELDSICRHEAEVPIVSLTRAVVAGGPLEGIAGLAFRDAQGEVVVTPLAKPPDITSLAWPDRRGEPEECLGHGMAPIVGSRGCCANCAFCCIAAWHALPPSGKRFRTRPIEDVADEIAWLSEHRGIDIFVFHDDNFFLPSHWRSLERINALADALGARGVDRIATVVKARPTDISREVVQAARDRLGCIRAYVGIETHAEQGLRTLTRSVRPDENREAMRVLQDLGLFVCFNLLIFDPDTTVESLEANLEFMETHAGTSSNFCRVELYAGTPLLARIQAEGRCRGDYLGWDYHLATSEMQRIFKITMQCFYERNFASDALANCLGGTQLQVEVCRHFHPEVYQASWHVESKDLTRRLNLDSVVGLREIIAFVGTSGGNDPGDFINDLSLRLRRTEQEVRGAAQDLEQTMQHAVGAGCKPLRTAAAFAASA